MPIPFISHLTDVTPAWLTEALTTSGALTRGQVTTMAVEAGAGNWSANGRLRLTYSADAEGERPAQLFLKLVNADLEDEFFGDSEVTYYTRDYVGVEAAPLLRCYAAAFSAEQRRYYLLLQDVTATHVPAAEKAPTLGYGLALAEALAALHAPWWGAARLAVAGAPPHTAEHFRRFAAIAEPGLAHILAHFTGDLPPDGPAHLRAFFAGHPRAMITRARDPRGQTLIHGDAGHHNILAPRAGERPLYLIDRQPFDWSLTTWLGVYDLAYALVLDWEVPARRQFEQPILQRYHAALLARGVTDYAWEQLYADYRLCAAMGLYIAVEYCRGEGGARLVDVWLPMLQRALAACADLECPAQW